MDSVPGFGDEHSSDGADVFALQVGGDERRMHVRAYNHWVSLLGGRPYPSIKDLNPASIADFGDHSVLLDFTGGIEDPKIQYLGRAVWEECGVGATLGHISEVPSRSLLSRLTDHYLQIIANRAPIGFEAEFVGIRGHNTLYRGILMPFSSDADTIDFIYGVINWKEMVDADVQAQLVADLTAARRSIAPAAAPAPVWADGPGAGFEVDADVVALPLGDDASLADRLAEAREHAQAFKDSEGRSRGALYRTLARAHGLASAAEAAPEDYRELLADAGIKPQARAPLTAVAKLVFGIDFDKTRLAEYSAVLTHAARHEIGVHGLAAYLENFPGGVKGVVGAERALRRKPEQPDTYASIAAELRTRAPLAQVAIDAGTVADGEFVVLLATRRGDALEVVARVDGDPALTARAVRRAAA